METSWKPVTCVLDVRMSGLKSFIRVLVTKQFDLKDGVRKEIDIGYFDSRIDRFVCERDDLYEKMGEDKGRVIAWMHLPRTYGNE